MCIRIARRSAVCAVWCISSEFLESFWLYPKRVLVCSIAPSFGALFSFAFARARLASHIPNGTRSIRLNCPFVFPTTYTTHSLTLSPSTRANTAREASGAALAGAGRRCPLQPPPLSAFYTARRHRRVDATLTLTLTAHNHPNPRSPTPHNHAATLHRGPSHRHTASHALGC